MIGIYKIENLINRKIYIGQSIHIKERWRQHIQEAKSLKNKRPLYLAIRKYGVDNFSFEVVEECKQELLDEREKFWIKYYNSLIDKNGYNLTIGGQSGGTKYYIDDIYALWDKGYSISEIKDSVSIGKSSIRNYLIDYPNYSVAESNRRGGVKARKTAIENGNIFNCCTFQPIKQYSLSGKFIREWESCNQIERELNIDAETVGRCLNKKQKHAGYYQWVRGDEKPNDIRGIVRFYLPVIQYDLDGNEICRYSSSSAAATAMNCDVKNITNCCRHIKNRKTACGYKWEYENSPFLE